MQAYAAERREKSLASFGFGRAFRSIIATSSSQTSGGSWIRVRSATERLARLLGVSSLVRTMRSI